MPMDPMIEMEFVKLADGRFGIQAVGETEPDQDIGPFDTQAEAEAWLFDRAERLEAQRDEPPVLKPGFGQGIR